MERVPTVPKGRFRGRGKDCATSRIIRYFSAAILSTFVWVVLSGATALAQEQIDITKRIEELDFPKPVPVNISGFTGEADAELRQDLTFMGFIFVGPDAAKFLITGSNAGRVECRVVEKVNKQQVLGKAYTGSSQRAQVHALADDIAQTITGKPGIAQTKIAFKAERGGTSEIYIADYDGFNAQSVTQDHNLVAAPAWAGHARLFYVSYKLGPCNIFSHQLTTGARKAVTRTGGSNMSPAVSPDGSRLAMILSKSGNPELYVSDLDGNDLRKLTTTREAASSPCWSPDGRSICYTSRERGPASLFVISASGGAPRRLSTAGVPSATEPDWSPDGKWIAFTTLRRDFVICLVKAEGGEAHELVPGEDPSWAPNSRALIYSHGTGGSKSLCLLDVPTKRFKTLPRISESNSQPGWAR